MNELRQLHRKAMDFVDQAESAKLHGSLEAEGLTRLAFEHERDAARMLESDIELEPTRSVLYRSAASLALRCGEIRESEKLIAVALSGEPPEEIANELRDLLEQVHFQRHLDLRGWNLQRDEVQLSIAGKSVGFGLASADQFIERVQNFEKLVRRTAERKAGVEYKEGGRPSKSISESANVLISVPRAASFAVSLQVGQTIDQLPFELGLLDEILTCLELFEANDDKKLEERISDTAYYTNFVGLARQIAPDGEDINLVGLTALSDGEQRKVALTRTRNTVSALPADARNEEPNDQYIMVSGTLNDAKGTKRHPSRIKLENEEGVTEPIIVPKGMMSDIVRPLWDYEVEVVGIRRGKSIYLQDIVPVK